MIAAKHFLSLPCLACQVWCCLCQQVAPTKPQGLDKPYKLFRDHDGTHKVPGKDICHVVEFEVHPLPTTCPRVGLPERCWQELWACPACFQAPGRSSFGDTHSERDRNTGTTFETEHRRLSEPSEAGVPALNTRGQADALRAVVLQQDAEIVDAVCQLSSAESKVPVLLLRIGLFALFSLLLLSLFHTRLPHWKLSCKSTKDD